MAANAAKLAAQQLTKDMVVHVLRKAADRNEWAPSSLTGRLLETPKDGAIIFRAERGSEREWKIYLHLIPHMHTGKLIVAFFEVEQPDGWDNTTESVLGLKGKQLSGIKVYHDPDISLYWVVETAMDIVHLLSLYDWFMRLHDAPPVFNLPDLPNM